jgi:hypothetical protein
MQNLLSSCGENIALTAVAINLIIMVKGAIGGLNSSIEVLDREQSEKLTRIDLIEKQIKH